MYVFERFFSYTLCPLLELLCCLIASLSAFQVFLGFKNILILNDGFWRKGTLNWSLEHFCLLKSQNYIREISDLGLQVEVIDWANRTTSEKYASWRSQMYVVVLTRHFLRSPFCEIYQAVQHQKNLGHEATRLRRRLKSQISSVKDLCKFQQAGRSSRSRSARSATWIYDLKSRILVVETVLCQLRKWLYPKLFPTILTHFCFAKSVLCLVSKLRNPFSQSLSFWKHLRLNTLFSSR